MHLKNETRTRMLFIIYLNIVDLGTFLYLASDTNVLFARFWQCFFPQYVVPSMRTPLFVINAAFDSWQVGYIPLYYKHIHFIHIQKNDTYIEFGDIRSRTFWLRPE